MSNPDIVERLRSAGWSVAVHNDYRLDTLPMTFWLFTHSSGVWAKGEGYSDAEALAEVEKQAAGRLRSQGGGDVAPLRSAPDERTGRAT